MGHHSSISVTLFCPVLPCGPGRFAARSPAFGSNRVLFSQVQMASGDAKSNHTSLSVLQHIHLNNVMPFLVDGVHLTQAALKKYYFSIHRVIIRAKQFI